MCVDIVVGAKISNTIAQKIKPKSSIKKACEICDEYISSRHPFTEKEHEAANIIISRIKNQQRMTYINIIRERFKDIPINPQNKALLQKFIDVMETFDVNPKTYKALKKAQNSGDLFSALYNYSDVYSREEIIPICKEIHKLKKRGVPLEYEQILYKKQCFKEDCERYLHALFSRPSINPEVIKIENILKQEYGVKLALLEDDLITAKNVLASVELLKRNNLPIPDEYIVSRFHIGGRLLKTYDGQANTVLLGNRNVEKEMIYSIRNNCPPVSQNIRDFINVRNEACGFKSQNSSTAVEHLETHEGIHITHLPFYAFKMQRINKKFLNTIRKISGYCAQKPKCAHEIYTELKTKSLYQALEPDEEKLLNYLEGKK